LKVVNDNVKKVCGHPTRYDSANWNHRTRHFSFKISPEMNGPLKIVIGGDTEKPSPGTRDVKTDTKRKDKNKML
jgi:hypothetical protein